MTALLEVEDLAVHFGADAGVVRAVDGIGLRLDRGETLGIVGESGSGKSVSALALLRLVPTPPGRIVSGRVMFDGVDLLALPIERMRAIRGREIAMIFQDPMTSLNPVLTIGRQIGEVLELHLGLDAEAARKRTVELLEMVGIPSAAARVGDYPHHFSGGMRQRVMIAMAIACRPKLLIADEPTTALDVTIQAQILDLIRGLQRELGMAMIIITHDLGVVAGMADRVAVMYAGRIVEEGPSEAIFADPRMPYTIGLIQSVPRADDQGQRRLTPIAGAPPEPHGETRRCRFA
ncbi:MAG: ABC transporter ATP-binding protein, partial [Alphaproteobacteria bacterium]|nr:ABC transporter ATP-binding protein [Alphaproteobacteria bacterium]